MLQEERRFRHPFKMSPKDRQMLAEMQNLNPYPRITVTLLFSPVRVERKLSYKVMILGPFFIYIYIYICVRVLVRDILLSLFVARKR